jgi:D-glycero-beta-D-manno-heptose-7-phosphate kinase
MKPSVLLPKLSRFDKAPILVIGDLMVDRYIRGSVNRLSPEAPVPVVEVKQEDFMPGGAGNVACNILELGGAPSIISVVGEDSEGDRLLTALSTRGVDVQSVQVDASRPTIVKTRIYAGHQQVVRFDHESRHPLSHAVIARILDQVQRRIKEVKGVIVSDYGKGVVSSGLLKALLPLARRYKKFITVDPKIEHFMRYRGVHCITPNLKEAAEGMRVLPPKNDAEVDALGARILKRLRCHTVLITRGERGMSLYKAHGKTLHIPSYAREVFDVTGAGDTVISTLSLALAAGCSFEEAAHISNVAAGVVVGKLGTATVRPDEIRQALKRGE